ncbi:hypothetical protein XvhCFBP2543_05965 [Xanthomonas vasicola]|nr:hypothetical protein NX05_21120 [Xanthomonas vasicola]KGR42817.1 hypothetical protein NX04_10360 [Xanthomonas vasicola]KGR60444.1 hypothetical protein NX79_10630 [Xanthomonas vasicola]PPV03379.1 hypothetical protein XvhCFBP2543_05965 [Xanthomonas vasicola]
MATGAERGVDASEEEGGEGERECGLIIYSQFRHDRLRGQIPSVDRLGMTASIVWGNCVHARGATVRRRGDSIVMRDARRFLSRLAMSTMVSARSAG